MLIIKPHEDIKDVEYWDLIYKNDEEDKGEAYYVEN